MRKLTVLICTLALALVAAGCGSSGGSDSSGDDSTTTTTEAKSGGTGDGAEEYTAAFVVNFSSGSEEEGNLVLAEDVAACVAPKFVSAITVETLQENDVAAADIEDPSWDGSSLGLSADQGQDLVDSFGACDVDIVTMFAESLTAGLTAEQQACAVENVDPDLTEALLVKTFSSGDSDAEFEAVIADLTATCELPG